MEEKTSHFWPDEITDREWAQIKHAVEYRRKHSRSGVPGHGQFILVAKLAHMLAEREERSDEFASETLL